MGDEPRVWRGKLRDGIFYFLRRHEEVEVQDKQFEAVLIKETDYDALATELAAAKAEKAAVLEAIEPLRAEVERLRAELDERVAKVERDLAHQKAITTNEY